MADQADQHDTSDVPDGSFANVLDATVEPVTPLGLTPDADPTLLGGTEPLPTADAHVVPQTTHAFSQAATQNRVAEASELVTPISQPTPDVVNAASESKPTQVEAQVEGVQTSAEETQRPAQSLVDGAEPTPVINARKNAASRLESAASNAAVAPADGGGEPVVVAETPGSPSANATPNKEVTVGGEGANQPQSDSQQESSLSDGESSDRPQDKVAFESTRSVASDTAGKQTIRSDAPMLPARVDFTPSADLPLSIDTASHDALAQVGQVATSETQPTTSVQRTTTPDALTQLSTIMSGKFEEAGRLPARIEIELDPPELGRLNVELTDSRQGITAKITASRESTAVLIDHQLAGLKQTLQDSGIEVHEFQVTYDSANTESGNEGSESQAARAEEMEEALTAGRIRRESRAAEASSHQSAGRRAMRNTGRVDLQV